MLDKFYAQLSVHSSAAVVIISIAIMLFAGFLGTRITKLLKLPNVTAYILIGIVLGPYCLDLVPSYVSEGMDFISDIALAFIAFSVGEYFRFSVLRRNGGKTVVITLFEALLASVLVFVITYWALGFYKLGGNMGLAFSLILAALASATAPASTMMTIRQTGAKGDFVNTLFGVVALDDVVSLLAYSVAVSVAGAAMGEAVSAGDILLPIAYNLMMIAIGIGFGFILKFLMAKRSTDNRLIVSVAFLFALCGIGAAVEVSPLLACMAMGTVYINISDDDKLFKQLNYFSPPILLLFFVKSGIGFDLNSLISAETSAVGIPLIAVGVLYFAVRLIGKYLGAFAGCAAVKKPASVRNYLGMALAPQAGVAIGLAALGARVLGGDIGSMLQTIILSSSILYELAGPALAKLALYLSGSFGKHAPPEGEGVPAPAVAGGAAETVSSLKEQLREIQTQISRKEYARSPEEEAFLEATEPPAEDSETSTGAEYNRRKFINKR